MLLQDYTVTAKAGEWVAGREVKPGDTLSLWDYEAAYEVDLGYLVLVGPSSPQPPSQVVTGADIITGTRGGVTYRFSVDDLLGLLGVRSLGPLTAAGSGDARMIEDWLAAIDPNAPAFLELFGAMFMRFLASRPVYSGDGPAPVPAGELFLNNGIPQVAQ